jgi:hypothetical protein
MSDILIMIKEIAAWVVVGIISTMYLLAFFRQCCKIWFEEQMKARSIDEKRRLDLKTMYLESKKQKPSSKGITNE